MEEHHQVLALAFELAAGIQARLERAFGAAHFQLAQRHLRQVVHRCAHSALFPLLSSALANRSCARASKPTTSACAVLAYWSLKTTPVRVTEASRAITTDMITF